MSSEELQLFVKGIGSGSQIIRIAKNATIQELFQNYADHMGLKGDFGLVYVDKELREKNQYGKIMHLDDYGIEDESNISARLRLNGGTEKHYGPNVELSNNPDMMYLDDQTIDMPCGHAIGPNSMTSYAQSQVSENKYKFSCPAWVDITKNETCKYPWDFKDVKKAAIFTKDERTQMEGKIAENFMRFALKCQQCPRCNSYSERKNKGNPRVICHYCTSELGSNYEYCWDCLRQWKTSGTSNCGNDKCENVSIVYITKCETKSIGDIPDCPKVRGCPHCGTLIEHETACKQMNCFACKKDFCFICLKLKVNGVWQCGSYNTPCKPAPRQTKLAG